MLRIEMKKTFYALDDHTPVMDIAALIDLQARDGWLKACSNLSGDNEHNPVLEFEGVELNAQLEQALDFCDLVLGYQD